MQYLATSSMAVHRAKDKSVNSKGGRSGRATTRNPVLLGAGFKQFGILAFAGMTQEVPFEEGSKDFEFGLEDYPFQKDKTLILDR